VEAGEGDDGDGLGVCPRLLFPEGLCENDGPHGVFAVGAGCRACAELALDVCVHAALDHGEEHGLHGAVELVVPGAEIGRADVGEDGLSDEGAEGRGGGAGEQGEEGPEETGDGQGGGGEEKGAHSMEEITRLLRRMTRLWRRVLRVSGASAP
jgi:hypothetical protein